MSKQRDSNIIYQSKLIIAMKTRHLVTERPVRITPIGCEASIVVNAPGMVHVDRLQPVSHHRSRRLRRLVSSDCAALYSSPQGLRRRITVSLPTEQATEDRFFEEFDYLIGLAKLKGEL